MPDWTPYLQTGAIAAIAWLIKNQIQTAKDVVKLQTVMEYYIERQTEDAARRLDVNNPVPPDIQALVRKHIHQVSMEPDEQMRLTNWLKQTGKGLNPEVNPAERSAALQLLTGIRTKEQLGKKRPWWRWIF